MKLWVHRFSAFPHLIRCFGNHPWKLENHAWYSLQVNEAPDLQLRGNWWIQTPDCWRGRGLADSESTCLELPWKSDPEPILNLFLRYDSEIQSFSFFPQTGWIRMLGSYNLAAFLDEC